MTITQLQLYNGALLLLKEPSLASLAEDREPRYKLDEVWNTGANGGAIRACLESAGWFFAKRSVRLDQSTTITPDFGLSYAFEKPTDFIRLMAIATDERFNNPLNDYTYEGGCFWADVDPIYLQYVSDDTDFGGDWSQWPTSFIEYVKTYLASKIAGKITGNKTDQAILEKELGNILRKAEGNDTAIRPAAKYPTGSWVRGRNRGWYDTRRR